jgi:hypothetical protein
LLVSGIVAAGWAQQYVPTRIRTVQNLNLAWTFIKQDVAVGTATGTTDPSGWSALNMPHYFDIPYFGATAAVSPYVGWYRKHYTVAQQAINANMRFLIEFEGAFLVTTVYVNGTQVGQHKGGYTPFFYDITSQLKAGDNIIAARVDGTWPQAQVAPAGGDHVFIGGIYRNVSMIVTEPLHVDWYGTSVTTPTTSTVEVKTDVVNSGTASKSCTVKSIVVDATMATVTTMQSTQTVAAGATVTFDQTSGTISSPHLWSPTSPYLYHVYTEVYDGAQLVDNYVSPLGIRTMSWSATTGFFLNGSHLWIHGANVHQDHAGWGDATENSGSLRDVKMIHDCGMNFIRGSHYPHSPAFANACDSLGILFWSEMSFWCSTNGGYPSATTDQTAFNANTLLQLGEMIKVYRNHPSIIIWSMCNEPFFAGSEAQNKALLASMVSQSHTQDPTRLAAIGGCQRDGSLNPPYYKIGDVAGVNGDGASIATYMNGTGGVPTLVTEYGSCSENRPGNYNACWGNVQNTNDTANQYAWRCGIVLWCGFHYGTWSSYGQTGMIDHARLPLERWYYYRQKNLGVAPPTWPSAGTASKLVITTDRDTITDDGKTDAQVIVQIQNSAGAWLSNTANITLTTTSGLFPSQAPAGGTSITFTSGATNEGVLNGMCAIEFRGYVAGTATLTATSSGLTNGTKTIVINHVVDSPIVFPTGVLGRQIMAPAQQQIMRQVRFFGKSLMVPPELRGRTCSVAIYSLQGRLISEFQFKGNMPAIKVKNAAANTLIAHFTTR